MEEKNSDNKKREDIENLNPAGEEQLAEDEVVTKDDSRIMEDGKSTELSAEEADAIARGLENLQSQDGGIPEIQDIREIEDIADGFRSGSRKSVEDTPVFTGESSIPGGGETGATPVAFPDIGEAENPEIPSSAGVGMDLMMDIPIKITVVLGRAQMTIGEILSLEPGSVVELDRLAGEPVEILANDKLILKGEVVVIDENFGIRVTELIGRRRSGNLLK